MKRGSKSLQKQTKGTKGTVIPNEWGVNSFAGEMISAALILGIGWCFCSPPPLPNGPCRTGH